MIVRLLTRTRWSTDSAVGVRMCHLKSSFRRSYQETRRLRPPGSWMTKCFLAFLITVLCPLGNLASGGNPLFTSQYTSIKHSDCSTPSSDMVSAFEARGLEAKECSGPKDWRLFVVSSGERSWVEIVRGYSLWSTEDEVVYRNELGYFPNLGAERVEWRIMKSGSPTALIFRITAQNPNHIQTGSGPEYVSRLFVIGLANGVPRLCGIAKTNVEALALADKANTCSRILPERKLK